MLCRLRFPALFRRRRRHCLRLRFGNGNGSIASNRRKLLQNIVDGSHHLRPFAYEVEATEGIAAIDTSGDRHHRPSLFAGQSARYERTALSRRFDSHDATG